MITGENGELVMEHGGDHNEPMGKPVITWDGKNLPDGLKGLPPGRYALEPMQEITGLSDAEEQGILDALRELDAGHGKSLADVVADLKRTAGRQ